MHTHSPLGRHFCVLRGMPMPLRNALSYSAQPIYRLRVMAVLAPADFKRKVARNPQPGQAKGLAGALMGAFKAWDKPDQDDAKLQELAKRTAERATEVRPTP